jgi:hypothetical protein
LIRAEEVRQRSDDRRAARELPREQWAPASQPDLMQRQQRVPVDMNNRRERMRAWNEDRQQKLRAVQELMNNAERP